MPDQTINCKDCQTEFVFTEGEAEWFTQNQFQPPKRCKPCRDKRKAQNNESRATQAPVMAQEPTQEETRAGKNRRKGGRRDDRDERY